MIMEIGILIANLAILGLNLKLYTEFAKQRMQEERGGRNNESIRPTDRF